MSFQSRMIVLAAIATVLGLGACGAPTPTSDALAPAEPPAQRFQRFDANQDGSWNMAEFKAEFYADFCKKPGMTCAQPGPNYFPSNFAQYDHNGDGGIDQAEYLKGRDPSLRPPSASPSATPGAPSSSPAPAASP